MEFVNGAKGKRVLDIRKVLEREHEGKGIRMSGAIYTIRHMGEVAFIILRKSRGLVQCVYEAEGTDFDTRNLKEESAMEVMGIMKAEERAPQGFGIRLKETRALPRLAEPLPLVVSKRKLNTSLETKSSLRPISLRNVRERTRSKIQEGVVREFRDYLSSQSFTKIRTPKIVMRGAEGGSNVFKLKYSNEKAELEQSSQFYRQTIVGVYDRVFEAVPVSQAEKHNTTHHFNEHTSLDFEMGYIDGSRDVVDMETGILQYTVRLLEQEYKKELGMLGVTLPEVGRIPAVRFDQAKELVPRKYGRKVRNPYDLEPEEELLIGRYFKEEYRSGFMLVTHYPSKKRLSYATDDPEDLKSTPSFDLMLRELEVTTGGQEIHDYREVTDKTEKRDMDPEDIASYLMIFKYGMSPHDGLGTGLEHLTMRLLDEQDVREAPMFLRDVTRLESQGQGDD